jgi:TetR/AcrR family transcriptional regulator, transcriptional repressor for nem operon
MSKTQEIISIAREVIHSKGYQATSISDILHAANILEWAITFHAEMKNKPGCPIGNLAIEMSEHDETFLKDTPFLLANYK